MEHFRKTLRSGFVEYQADTENVWISAAEANSVPELVVLYKEIRKMLDEEYPKHGVQFFIDATNEKLLEAFIGSSEFEIEYVSFKWLRPNQEVNSSISI